MKGGIIMFKDRKRWVRCSVLAALSAGFVMGTGVIGAEANNIVVNKKDQTITQEIYYSGNTGKGQPTAVIFVPVSVSGGTITINPGNKDDNQDPSEPPSSSPDFKIQGDFTSSDSDTGNSINSSGIQLLYRYKGELDVGAGTDIEVRGNGPRLNGAGIHSNQSGAGTDPSDTSIILGNNVKVYYGIEKNNTTNASVYGIYNNKGTLTTGNHLSIQMENGGGRMAAGSNLVASGIFNHYGSIASIGDYLKLYSRFESAGTTTGVVAGMDSGKMAETLNQFKLGNYADVKIYFKGQGKQGSSSSDVFEDTTNVFGIRDMYLANSRFFIGNYNSLEANLDEDSTASVVAGTVIRSSEGTIGDNFSESAVAWNNTKVDQLNGFYVDGKYYHRKSNVTAGKGFSVQVSSTGFANESKAVSVSDNSELHLGNEAFLENKQINYGTTDKSANLAAVVYEDGNSLITAGDDSSFLMLTRNNNISKMVNINLENSRMTIGKNARIHSFTDNNDYDDKSQLYGVNVFKTSEQADEKADINIGENAAIVVTGNNMGKIGGLKNSIAGTAALGDYSTITVAQTSSEIYNPEDITADNIQQGSGQYIAGYMGNQAEKTTFNNHISIHVWGNTDTANASAYGSDNAYGDLETKDNLSVTVNTTGYTNSYGLSTVGQDDAHRGNTVTGNNLTVNVTGDKTAYGIYNGYQKNGYSQTIVGNHSQLTVKGDTAAGISSSGSEGTVIMGDKAKVETEGSRAAFGILNQYGANTTFKGAAEITSRMGSDLGYAAYSMDEGSLIDIRGEGQKQITGNLMSRNDGTILLTMDTGDSFLTGKSDTKVPSDSRVGTTNIDMSNGALWNMTDSSTVTNLTNNSGATVDMTYNKNGTHTLTVGNFSGNDGIFLMQSDLASQEEGDKVNITSAAAGSSGLISVYDRSFVTGNRVMGVKHLLMVKDASKNATFSGKSLDTGGLWEITPTIQRGGTFTDADGKVVGKPNEWYLVTMAKKPNKDTTPVIDIGDNTYGLYRLSIDTLRQRLGDLRYRNRSDDKYDFWVRDRHGLFDGSGYDSKYNFFQVGVDTMPNEKSAYGFLVERGIASPRFDTGSGKNHTLAGALYATWIGDHGNYTDIVAKIGRNDTTLHTYGAYADKASYREDEKSLSFEYGRTLGIGEDGYFFEPQAQIVFGHLGSNSYTTRRGTHVHEDSFDSAIGRLGFVLGKKQKNGENPHDFYLKASILHEFGGDRDYSLRRVNAYGDEETLDGSYNYRDTWYEVGFGGNVKINNNTSFYADVERSFGSDYTKKWQINAGINWSF